MVSRKTDAICFHCGAKLNPCNIDYGTFMNMTEEERNKLKNEYKSELLLNDYKNNINQEMNTFE